MNPQEIETKFKELKAKGKINSEIDAFVEGIIFRIEQDTNNMVDKINQLFKGESHE